jgi:hypothetical protein
VAITEDARHRLYQRLEEVLGDEQATTLMEHLPPVGWADVATKRDLDHLQALTQADIERFRVETRAEFAAVRGEIAAGLAAVRGETAAGLAAVRGDMDTGFAALRGEMHTGFAELRTEIAHLGTEVHSLLRRQTMLMLSAVTLLGAVGMFR